MTSFRVGCSGWSYGHWRNNFYPKGLPQTRWLEHYASQFDTVELNATFYRLPSENAVRAWRERAPPGFCYAAKVSRFITHFRRLRDCEAPLQRYLDRIRLLGYLLQALPRSRTGLRRWLQRLRPERLGGEDQGDERCQRSLSLLPQRRRRPRTAGRNPLT